MTDDSITTEEEYFTHRVNTITIGTCCSSINNTITKDIKSTSHGYDDYTSLGSEEEKSFKTLNCHEREETTTRKYKNEKEKRQKEREREEEEREFDMMTNLSTYDTLASDDEYDEKYRFSSSYNPIPNISTIKTATVLPESNYYDDYESIGDDNISYISTTTTTTTTTTTLDNPVSITPLKSSSINKLRPISELLETKQIPEHFIQLQCHYRDKKLKRKERREKREREREMMMKPAIVPEKEYDHLLDINNKDTSLKKLNKVTVSSSSIHEVEKSGINIQSTLPTNDHQDLSCHTDKNHYKKTKREKEKERERKREREEEEMLQQN